MFIKLHQLGFTPDENGRERYIRQMGEGWHEENFCKGRTMFVRSSNIRSVKPIERAEDHAEVCVDGGTVYFLFESVPEIMEKLAVADGRAGGQV